MEAGGYVRGLKAIGTIGRAWADTVYSDFADAYSDLRLFTERALCKPGEFVHSVKGTFSWHSGMRNEMVAAAEGEWLFQTDTDHVFAPDLLVRLLHIMETEKVNIVSGIYQYKARGSGHGPVAGYWSPEGRFMPMAEWDRRARVLDVGAVGGGCLLVKTELFRRMRAAFKCEPFDQIGNISEDYSFCRRAVQMGERIVLAPQVESHHLIRSALSVRDVAPRGDIKVVPMQGGVVLSANPTEPGPSPVSVSDKASLDEIYEKIAKYKQSSSG